MERGVRGVNFGRLCSSCLQPDGLGRSGSLAFLSAPLLDACPTTKICWVAARTSSSSIEYLLARRNKSSIVVGGFLASDSKNGVPRQMLRLKICRTTSMLVLMFCLCRAEHKYCPTKASDSMSSSLLLMEPMGGSFGRFLPTCRTAWCGGTFCTIGVTKGRCAPGLWCWRPWPSSCGPSLARIASDNWGLLSRCLFAERRGLLLLSQGILTLGQALSSLPSRCFLEESLHLSLAFQLSSLDGLAPFEIIFFSPSRRAASGRCGHLFFPAKDVRTGCPDTPSDGFVMAGSSSPYRRLSEIVGGDLPSFLSFRSAGGGRLLTSVNDPSNISG
ncbi:hypothetical protein AAG906_007600 [Vitis piasezkii]